MNRLTGKVAVVLGASAEGGTGWAIAEALAEAGAKVVVGARSIAPLQRLADKIGGAAVPCDAGNEAQVKQLIDTAVKQYGALHIAVNSAGLPVLSTIADSTEEQLQSALQVNYLGNVYFIKHAAAAMQGEGSIVVISSLSTQQPIFPHFAYACAKAATDCLVRYAAIEYGPRNIKVNSILAGSIVSDMSRDLFADPRVRAVFEKEVPLGRLGYPQDFADAVLWLSGPAFVTGLNIPVSGGNQLTRFPTMAEMPQADTWEGKGQTLFERERAGAGPQTT
jgi:NAD(P)-dependent dehydrogenase (short-subunit alcohol dehydrogenase family)